MPKKRFLLFVILLVLIAGGFIVRKSFAASDPKVDENGDVQTLDFSADIGQKKIFVTFSGRNDGEITVKNSPISYCSSKLTGFENSAKISQLLKVDDNLRLIEITGYVGVHAENRQYFYLDDKLCPRPVTFVKDKQIDYNVYSDQPNFLISDYNFDGVLDLAVEDRNYDLNPLTDGIRNIYLFDPSAKRFTFKRSENYQQAMIN